MERFLRQDAPTVVTVYAPITFPPAGTLVFKQRDDGKMHGGIQLYFLLTWSLIDWLVVTHHSNSRQRDGSTEDAHYFFWGEHVAQEVERVGW